MVLVALAGPVGSGKTTLLSSLARRAQEGGTAVDGFLAIPQNRRTAQSGAQNYVLVRIASGEEMPFASRDESLSPPYRVEQGTVDALRTWAVALAAQPPLSLLLLDEFGPLEVKGLGHMAYWEHLWSAKPDVIVIAVRDHLVTEIEDRLKIPFDMIIDAASQNARRQLETLLTQHSDWVRVGQFGAAAGGFEATVGSALHGVQIPLRGLFLSTVQSLVMMYAGDRMTDRSRVVWVPFISAGLKALSPSGSRLRPMLAIAAQGILFSLAVTVLGWNLLGIACGGWLVGAWAASQGIVLQYLFVGEDLFRAMDAALRWLAERLEWNIPGVAGLILLWVSSWGVVSAFATLLAWRRRHRLPERLSALLAKGTHGMQLDFGAPTWSEAVRKGLRDLLRPFFWGPLFIVVIIILATGSGWEQGVWIVLRAVTVGWVLFSLARMIDPRKLLGWLRQKGHWGPALALSRALQNRRGNTPPGKGAPDGTNPL